MTDFAPIPSYIPREVCLGVGLDPATPVDECMARIRQEINDQSISAPPYDRQPLEQLVHQAQQKGIDLKVVVIDRNPAMDTSLRDVATVVGQDHPSSTVVVLSPTFVGTYSKQFDRSKLEAAEDHAKTGNQVISAQNFVQELYRPDLPWTGITIVLVLCVALAAIGTRMIQHYARTHQQDSPTS